MLNKPEPSVEIPDPSVDIPANKRYWSTCLLILTGASLLNLLNRLFLNDVDIQMFLTIGFLPLFYIFGEKMTVDILTIPYLYPILALLFLLIFLFPLHIYDKTGRILWVWLQWGLTIFYVGLWLYIWWVAKNLKFGWPMLG